MDIPVLHQLYSDSSGVTTDSRTIVPGNIFFALKGDKFNANQFAAEAFKKGAKLVIVDEISDPNWKQEFSHRLILVKDALQTLQQLAAYHRKTWHCPVLAITGSNGKTTTKELILSILSSKFKAYATKGNLNNQIGIPLTILSMPSDVEFAIIEMGANHQGEIASYCEYAAPNYGLITNVGLAHLDGFGGFEGVVKAKTELYAYLKKRGGHIFLNYDNEILASKIEGYPDIITYGKSGGAEYRGKASLNDGFIAVEIEEKNEAVNIQSQLVGEYNFENVLSAVCVGKYFGVETEKIKGAIEGYRPSNNRSQKIAFGSNTVILDAYNANPSSMKEALKNFERLNAEHKIVILGEMMELGEYARGEHEKIAAQAIAMPLEQRVFVGRGFDFLNGDKEVTFFESTDELKQWFKSRQFENRCMLIKGSRKNELEKILT